MTTTLPALAGATPLPDFSTTGYRRQAVRAERVRAIKDRLDLAFRSLRKQGIVAKQNFGGSQFEVGGYMGRLVLERLQAGKTITGAVYYNTQNGGHLREGWDLYIGFAGVVASPDGFSYEQPDARTTEVGQALQAALEAQGLTVFWNGTAKSTLRVYHWPETQTLFPVDSIVLCPGNDVGIVTDHSGINVNVTFDKGEPNEHHCYFPHHHLKRANP